MPAGVGEDEEDQQRSRRDIERALDRSVEAEGGEDKTSWAGADAEIEKDRPKSILNQLLADYERVVQSPFLANAFCPTGPGGGVDPTCSPDNFEQLDGQALKHAAQDSGVLGDAYVAVSKGEDFRTAAIRLLREQRKAERETKARGLVKAEARQAAKDSYIADLPKYTERDLRSEIKEARLKGDWRVRYLEDEMSKRGLK